MELWQRFTSRARRAILLAHNDATTRHAKLITDAHLLLGLLKLDEGEALQVLRSLGVDLEALREDVDARCEVGEGEISNEIAFTPEAQSVLQLAYAEARSMQHPHIGTEHVLLGLLRLGKGPACEELHKRGVELEVAREQVGRRRADRAERPDPGPPQEVSTSQQLTAILGDPRRLRILEILTKQQASVKKLAGMIQETPQSTHYHTKQLEKAGLIKIVKRREVRGVVEKFYRAVARRFLLDPRAVGDGPDHKMSGWMGIAREWIDLGDYHLETVESDSVSATGMFTVVNSDKDTVEKFSQRLSGMAERFATCEREGTGQRYALLLGVFPIPSDLALPEDPGAFLDLAEGVEGLDLGAHSAGPSEDADDGEDEDEEAAQ